jgi:hypothetical protein
MEYDGYSNELISLNRTFCINKDLQICVDLSEPVMELAKLLFRENVNVNRKVILSKNEKTGHIGVDEIIDQLFPNNIMITIDPMHYNDGFFDKNYKIIRQIQVTCKQKVKDSIKLHVINEFTSVTLYDVENKNKFRKLLTNKYNERHYNDGIVLPSSSSTMSQSYSMK